MLQDLWYPTCKYMRDKEKSFFHHFLLVNISGESKCTVEAVHDLLELMLHVLHLFNICFWLSHYLWGGQCFSLIKVNGRHRFSGKHDCYTSAKLEWGTLIWVLLNTVHLRFHCLYSVHLFFFFGMSSVLMSKTNPLSLMYSIFFFSSLKRNPRGKWHLKDHLNA